MAITIVENNYDFTELHERMDWYVNQGIIPFVSTLLLKGDDVLDLSFHGKPDHASEQLLAEDTIFRMHSSTKIACSVAAMTLWERGCFKLDDPIEKYIPALGDMQVLQVGATAIDQTEPANGSIQIKHVLSHTAGFSYGFIEPESVIDSAYNSGEINPMLSGSEMTLESLCESLGGLPLAYQPGTFWWYRQCT